MLMENGYGNGNDNDNATAPVWFRNLLFFRLDNFI